jgi:hypothetical protein
MVTALWKFECKGIHCLPGDKAKDPDWLWPTENISNLSCVVLSEWFGSVTLAFRPWRILKYSKKPGLPMLALCLLTFQWPLEKNSYEGFSDIFVAVHS